MFMKGEIRFANFALMIKVVSGIAKESQ